MPAEKTEASDDGKNGLELVRAFIIYHDYMHGSLLRGSRLARVVLYTLGLLMLTPPPHSDSPTTFTTPMLAK